MEFNEKRGQTVLIKYRAWPDNLFTYDCPLLAPYPSVFPRFFLLKPPASLPFLACGSSPKHSMISFAQSQNALPLQPIKYSQAVTPLSL